MRRWQGIARLHPRFWLPAALVCVLGVQVASGVAIEARQELRLWRGAAGGRPDPCVASVIARARGDTVLYVTPDSANAWPYFQLSYELYPSTVWWATPVRRASPVDWWVSTPLDGPSLVSLAASKGARWLIADGVEPSALAGYPSTRCPPQRIVIDLGQPPMPADVAE